MEIYQNEELRTLIVDSNANLKLTIKQGLC